MRPIVPIIIFALLTGAVILGGAYFIPSGKLSWGNISLAPAKTITVTGEAQSQERSQVAVFSAGASAINDSKEAAIADVNQKVRALIEAVKNFGIPEADIKTQNLNVYQNNETYYEDGRQKQRPGQWSVNNTIEMKLRDVTRASQLADILTQSGATNVYGPNFSLEDTKAIELTLFGDAITNARVKAEKIAAGSGGTLGKILTVAEGGTQAPVLFSAEGRGGGGGTPTEPGSGLVQKSVTVTFELN